MLQIPSWADEPLVVVPETSEVNITTDFAGTDVKAVGAMSGPGDLIIKLVGPQQEATLSRETKLGPFWVEGDTVKMEGAPSLLFLYATAPIASILSRGRAGEIRIAPRRRAGARRAAIEGACGRRLAQGILPAQGETGLLPRRRPAIRVFGNRLFIADMRLPGDLAGWEPTLSKLCW